MKKKKEKKVIEWWNRECHTLTVDPTSASYIGMSFLLTMIKQAVVAIDNLQRVIEGWTPEKKKKKKKKKKKLYFWNFNGVET